MNLNYRSFEDIIFNKKVILFGIGNQFKNCYKLLKDKAEIKLADNDHKKWGTFYDGLIIHNPENLLKNLDDETCIVVSSINNQYEIAVNLIKLYGINCNKLFSYTSSYYENSIYCVDKIKSNQDKINECYNILSDNNSKEYYLNSINMRIQRNPLFLKPNPCMVNLGEYGNILTLEKNDVIIDCGAYTGDTAEYYINKLGQSCYIYALEPFLDSYTKLKERIEINHWEKNTTSYNVAVGKTKGKFEILYNEDDFGMEINLNKKVGNKKQEILVDTIDNLFRTINKVDYIKMDIEGEEVNALKGASQIINKLKPKLMISAYHRIEDLWEIPNEVLKIRDDYKIYVGHAPGVSTEVEFYFL